ncbi:MAG: exonuclease SbcCD subunit D [Pyrinomonadaceae bacterium]|nr:exonuclease SbcCD subunit D [Pyrinomonadaceae bacterium]
MKFLHIADVHLGCRRYNLDERPKDFFRAWQDVVARHAVGNKVDFVLIAGDFFNSRKVDPQAMNHAMLGLQMLKEAGIPAIAIEGNHDQHDAVTDFSWLRSLSQWGLLKLLEPQHDEDGRIKLVPWKEEDRSGSYIDVAGARIFGSHWYGMTTNHAIPPLAEAIREQRDPSGFNILMLHTEVEGQLNRPLPALSIAKLKELRECVDYVALGHTHKRFELDGWAFNPGSLEACSIDEYREERGVYLVEVGEEDSVRQVKVEHLSDHVQRPFQRLSFDVSGLADADAVSEGVAEIVRRQAHAHDETSDDPAPIIEISLRGQLGFKSSLLDINRMRDDAQAHTGALHVLVRNQSVPVEYAVAVGLDAHASRYERERRIIEDLIGRDARFRDRAAHVAALVLKAKQLALEDEDPAKILEMIEQQLDAGVDEKVVEQTSVSSAEEQEPITPSAAQAIERNAAAGSRTVRSQETEVSMDGVLF